MKHKNDIHILKKVLLIIIMLFNFACYSSAQESNQNHQLEILFIGSSYFGTDNLPNIFYELVTNSGKEVYFDSYIPGGLLLDDHASSSITEEKIMSRKWDFIVLQGVGSILAYPDYYINHPVYPAIITLKDKILNNCPSTRIIYCMPWAYEDGMTWLGWADTYVDMQIKIYDKTIKYSNEIGFTIAPVGWAWYRILEESGYPLHYLHVRDWNHPSIKGSYIMACVIYSTIYINSTSNNPFHSSLDESEASYFQEISSSTVLDDIELWKITPYFDTSSTGNFKSNGNSDILHQNFPNPFSSVTNIPFNIKQYSFVEINIYDLFGRYWSNIVCEYKNPGNYIIPFNSEGLPNGSYFYNIRTNNCSQIKKLQVIK
ncbi:MAG: T9SS type A sorting domain-containing protein [Bacteroidales bacterium]|nr:T9SS type A sorting domain-containing protein [Bacteroidales bacterium]MCF8391870.1 T9SS type A sorting domain-containing protein [Bacteroidales bacterium]